MKKKEFLDSQLRLNEAPIPNYCSYQLPWLDKSNAAILTLAPRISSSHGLSCRKLNNTKNPEEL